MNIINLIFNSVCCGIIFTASLLMFLYGYKVISTILHSIFYFSLFFYSISIILTAYKIFDMSFFLLYFQFFLPFLLFISIYEMNFEKFNPKSLLFLLIPIFFILVTFFLDKLNFKYLNIMILLYHIVGWSISIIYTIKNKKQTTNIDKKEINLIVFILIFVAVFPFILYNIYLIFIEKKYHISIEIVIFPVTITSIIELYFMYRKNLLQLNHSYYESYDFLQKSFAIEKKTIIEKISSSIIHEIKNPLTSLISILQQLKTNNNNMSEEKKEKYLSFMEEELNRIKELANNFLLTVKKSEEKIEDILINEELEKIKEIIKLDIYKKNINLEMDCKINIKINRGKLREIFLNLIYNSIEANAKNIKIYFNNNSIYIEDDGDGIDESIKENIFKPFWTTKITGTGLGLNIVKEILNEYGYDIELYNNKNNTIFRIKLHN